MMRMAGCCDQSARSEEDGDSGFISSDERQSQRPQIRRPPGYAPNPSTQMSHLGERDGYDVSACKLPDYLPPMQNHR